MHSLQNDMQSRDQHDPELDRLINEKNQQKYFDSHFNLHFLCFRSSWICSKPRFIKSLKLQDIL